MKKILVVNGGSRMLPMFSGALNTTLSDEIVKYLSAKGYDVKLTKCDAEYDTKEEIQKFAWCDVVIWQFPAWWMHEPWQVKKYMDTVWMEAPGILYRDDGRTRKDPSKKYGTGGLATDKKYMISITWNAPEEAFTDPNQLFEGKGIDYALTPFHKAHSFVGMKPLPTFMCNDVMKNLNIPKYIEDLHQHLDKVFG